MTQFSIQCFFMHFHSIQFNSVIFGLPQFRAYICPDWSCLLVQFDCPSRRSDECLCPLDNHKDQASNGNNCFHIMPNFSTLHGSANFLMALICLFESVHQFGHLAFLAIVLSGLNFIDMQMATIITTVSRL
jgi:hypothetical protein